MPHAQTFDALVLRTYDTGEADRYCILLTREQGRLAARASGARKLNSRLGALLLPFRHLSVQLKESGGGWIVTSAAVKDSDQREFSLDSFSQAVQGVEILLRLVQHEGELPEVFDATRDFLRSADSRDPRILLGYTFRLLHLLGFLPDDDSLGGPELLSPRVIGFLTSARLGEVSSLVLAEVDVRSLQELQADLLREHLKSPLAAGKVAGEMMREG